MLNIKERSMKLYEELRNLEQGDEVRDGLTIIHRGLEIADLGKKALLETLDQFNIALADFEGEEIVVHSHEYFGRTFEEGIYTRYARDVMHHNPQRIIGLYGGVHLFDESQSTDTPNSFSVDPVRLCLALGSMNVSREVFLSDPGIEYYVPLNSIDGDIVQYEETTPTSPAQDIVH
jgi:hypothetical protein